MSKFDFNDEYTCNVIFTLILDISKYKYLKIHVRMYIKNII